MGQRNSKENLKEDDVKVVMHWMMTLFYLFVDNMSDSKNYKKKNMTFGVLKGFKDASWDDFYTDNEVYLKKVYKDLEKMKNVKITKDEKQLKLEAVLREKITEKTDDIETGTEAVEDITKSLENFNMSSEKEQEKEQVDERGETNEQDISDRATTPGNNECSECPYSDEEDKLVKNHISDSDLSESSMEKIRQDEENREVAEYVEHSVVKVFTLDSESVGTKVIVNQGFVKDDTLGESSYTFNIGSVLDSLKKPDSEESYEYVDEEVLDNYKNEVQEPGGDMSLTRISAEVEREIEDIRVREKEAEEVQYEDEGSIQVDLEFEEKLREQRVKNEESEKKIKEERAKRKAEFEKDIKERREKSRQRFTAFCQCLLLQRRFEEKERQWSGWIETSCRQPFIRTLHELAALHDLARETKNFEHVEDPRFIRRELDNLSMQVSCLFESFSDIFGNLSQLSNANPEKLFICILQKHLCLVAEKLLKVESLLEKTQLSMEWYMELNEVLYSFKSTDIPSTGVLRYICQNACPSAYENMEFPERKYENNVRVEEVSEVGNEDDEEGQSSGNEDLSVVDTDTSISNISSLKSVDKQYYEEYPRISNESESLSDPNLIPIVQESSASGTAPCTSDETKMREMSLSLECLSNSDDWDNRLHSVPNRPRSKSVEYCGSKKDGYNLEELTLTIPIQFPNTVFAKTVYAQSLSEEPALGKQLLDLPYSYPSVIGTCDGATSDAFGRSPEPNDYSEPTDMTSSYPLQRWQ